MDDSDPSVFRRNQPGDRQRALDIMLPMVESEEQVASDIYCLVGRIYKDMFQDSHFTDTQSRDSSIHWWAKALFIKCTSAGTTYETFHSLRTFQHTIPSIKKQKWHTDTGRNKTESNRETGRRICFGVKSVINFWFIFFLYVSCTWTCDCWYDEAWRKKYGLEISRRVNIDDRSLKRSTLW